MKTQSSWNLNKGWLMVMENVEILRYIISKVILRFQAEQVTLFYLLKWQNLLLPFSNTRAPLACYVTHGADWFMSDGK